MRYFVALADRDSDHGFTVILPDFPGWFARARTFYEVRIVAAKVLTSHLEDVRHFGRALLEPSSFEILMADLQYRSCEALLVAGPAAHSPEGL
jgi:predicted RNase H-like HicB family nuclease